MRRSVSIADIARRAGVSHSTVSRALRDSPLISSDVRQRIRSIAQEMDYVPNSLAQSLHARRTQTIGLVITSIADPFLSDVASGIEQVAAPAGLSIFLSASHNDPDQEAAAIETFYRRRVDGIVVAASRIGHLHRERLQAHQVPTVLINSQHDDGDKEPFPTVRVDDDAGARAAVSHLIQQGHSAIGYLGVANRPGSNRRRLAGYHAALRAVGIAPRDALIATAPPTEQIHDGDVAGGATMLDHLLVAGATAIFCYNDLTAVGVLTACHERGIAVPHDLSVVGYDDIALARYVSPALTTVHQPRHELGSTAMTMLLALMEDRPVDSVVLQPTLIRRRSTAAPSRSNRYASV